MGAWDKLVNGVSNIGGGLGGFALDTLKVGREFGDFDFGEGLQIFVDSVQEDLVGKSLVGLFGAEGVGGAAFDTLPQPVRDPVGTIGGNILRGMDWGVQELVDRPLGTLFTVMSFGNNLERGPQSMFDLNTWARAWEINDQRTFGQSLIASFYTIDPFDEDEYNSIKDDPLFNLLSGTADLLQELFLDPTVLIGGPAIKAARGGLVASTRAGGVIGRTYRSSGSNAILGKYSMPRTGSLQPSQVIGSGTGLRPGSIGGRGENTFLTKTDAQRAKIKEVQANVTAQRVRHLADSDYMYDILGRSVDNAALKKGMPLEANERFAVIKAGLGPIGQKMDTEALRMISNGVTTQQRINSFRLFAGDFSVLGEATDAARLIVDEFGGIKPDLFDQPGYTFGNAARNFSPGAQDAIDSFDFAMFSAFEQNLILSQRKGVGITDEGVLSIDQAAFDTIAEMPAEVALAGLEDLLGSVDNIIGHHNVGKLADRPDAATNLLRTGAFPGRISELPFGTRLQEVARTHRMNALENPKGVSYAEYVNPHKSFGMTAKVRWFFEKVPHTHIFFTEANAVEQFERVLDQAARIDNGSVLKSSGISVGETIGEFAAHRLNGDYVKMEELYTNTINKINSRMDEHFKNPDYGSLAGVDPSHRTVSDMWGTADKEWKFERKKIISLINEKGEAPTAQQAGKPITATDARIGGDLTEAEAITLRVTRDENANVIIQQFGVSFSQLDKSAVLPRYDIIDKQIRVWNKAVESKRVQIATNIAKRISDRPNAKNTFNDGAGFSAIDRVQKAFDISVVPVKERVFGPLRSPANTAYSYWRKGVLSTPKWPMRVQLDEQLRIAANIGALSTIANFRGAFESMREAQAVHRLENWDEFKKISVLEDELRTIANKNIDSIKENLKETLDDVTIAEVGLNFNKYSLTDLYNVVGKEGFEEAVKNVTKQIVKEGANRARLRRSYLAKGALMFTFMGNPVTGAAYGLVARHSRLRRINEAAQQTAALHYAGALKAEGRRLLAQALDASDVSAAKSLMSDADYIAKLAKDNNRAAKRVSNSYEAAEELLGRAGFQGINLGNSIFRGAFGDDTRFIEQIEASNSANEALSSIYRSAHDKATREAERFAPDYTVVDYLDRPSGEKWDQAFDGMMNLMTSGTSDTGFYRIVWGNDPYQDRVAQLVDLFENNPNLFTDLVQNSTDLMSKDVLTREDFKILASEIIDEYDQVLPAGYFDEIRERAAAGESRWDLVEQEFETILTLNGYSIKELMKMFETKKEYDQFVQTKAVEVVRESHPEFGKSYTPKTVKTGKDKAQKSWLDEKFENIFSVLAEIPSDQLSRHPYFRSVYEGELRRIVEPMIDDDGMILLSQKKINEIESFARDRALTDTRSLLYDLRETSRAAEVLTNVSPFLNAWQEVIGRWAGIAVDNPTFVANTYRLYSKPWQAEALGLSEIQDEDGNTYLTFRMTGGAYDDEGNKKTIFEVMPDSVKNKFIPAPLRSTTDTVRISKNSLNTILEGSPGVGPYVTMPLREIMVAEPKLEEAFDFMFPFGHPEGGAFERMVKSNLPSWAKTIADVGFQTHRYQAVRTRMMQDLVTQAQATGEFIDFSDESVWTDFEEEANSRADNWFMFKFAAALFSPASTTLISPYDPLKQEYRALQREHGKLIAEDMFLKEYGEDFFALTSSLSRSNDGLPASATTEELRNKHIDLINDLGDSGVAAYVVKAVGSDLEMLRYNQTVYNQQFLEPVSPGSNIRRRELYSGRELIENSQTRLGWRGYSQIADWVRSKQDEAAAAGLSTSLGSKHLQAVSATKKYLVSQLSNKYPAWSEEYNDLNSSDNKRIKTNNAFIKVLADPVVSQRDSALFIADYYRARHWVQTQLQQRKAAGGSIKLENTKSNEDLFLVWEHIRTELSLNPQFSAVFDRYFTRDMISERTFIDENDWPEGFLISGK